MSFNYQSDYQTKLKSPQWQKNRLQVLNRDKWRCKLCKDEETTLHVHHLEYQPKKQPWEYPLSNFVTLCEHCHHEVEILKDDNDFENIIIQKITWDSGIYTMMIYAWSLESVKYKIYRSNGSLIQSFSFSESTQDAHTHFFKRCRKLELKIEREELENYLSDFEESKLQ